MGTQHGLRAGGVDSGVLRRHASATSQGIIVVEAAGNGGENLDGLEYGSPFPAGRPDSGAIIVGAGAAPGCGTARRPARAVVSTYGTRVDVQGWGECVTTTGYGQLQSGADENVFYTSQFNGTSSASAIVAAAAAALSSAREQSTGAHLYVTTGPDADHLAERHRTCPSPGSRPVAEPPRGSRRTDRDHELPGERRESASTASRTSSATFSQPATGRPPSTSRAPEQCHRQTDRRKGHKRDYQSAGSSAPVRRSGGEELNSP